MKLIFMENKGEKEMKREYVLVSQGVEIMRTESQDKAVEIVKNSNDDYRKYVEECYRVGECPVDNYIELFIEDNAEKKIKELAKVFNKSLEFIKDEKVILELIAEWNNIIDKGVQIYVKDKR